MAERNDGGSAFPHPEERVNFDDSVGMTLRDYFAAHIARGATLGTSDHDDERFAARVYAVADALLKAREA